tara:strand:+ start:118 stop:651 length:534 start_codon:yes stop_codon:yes gene_type:complete
MPFSLVKKSLLLGSALLLAGQAFTADSTKQLVIDEDSFDCLGAMTQVGEFFVSNLLGNLDETVAVAGSETGGKYPVGSMVSLIPSEVMVKHQEGWSPETNDWEFFELSVSETGSKIAVRGTTEVVNQFGGNCFGCHQLAQPEWDLICGTGHGCAPLPISREQIHAMQGGDPRCVMKE